LQQQNTTIFKSGCGRCDQEQKSEKHHFVFVHINGFLFATKKSPVCFHSDFTKKKIATNVVYRVRESIFDKNMNE